MIQDNLKTIQTRTPLSDIYFSQRNIHYIQENIRYRVWNLSNKQHIIGKQNSNELKIVMRSVYLQNSLNQPDNLICQVKSLNEIVIEYCVKNIISNVKQYIEYNNLINSDRKVMEHSLNTSIKGNNQLEFKPFI